MMSIWEQIGGMLGMSEETAKRPPEEQQSIDEACRRLALYHYNACPFCVRVRNSIRQMGLTIEERNTRHSRAYEEELQHGGGMTQVPCLRIEHDDGSVQWLYESSDIIRYLKEQFAA